MRRGRSGVCKSWEQHTRSKVMNVYAIHNDDDDAEEERA
jgi:hypothetical protein